VSEQSYPIDKLNINTALTEYPPILKSALEALRTNFMGQTFPTNPRPGQFCYRIDEDKFYFWNGITWIDFQNFIADLVNLTAVKDISDEVANALIINISTLFSAILDLQSQVSALHYRIEKLENKLGG
jgi:hypothetical protein